MLQTNVPEIGGADIHSPDKFLTFHQLIHQFMYQKLKQQKTWRKQKKQHQIILIFTWSAVISSSWLTNVNKPIKDWYLVLCDQLNRFFQLIHDLKDFFFPSNYSFYRSQCELHWNVAQWWEKNKSQETQKKSIRSRRIIGIEKPLKL